MRSSTATGFLRPAERRPNLTVLTEALTTRVLFEGKRAVGLEYRRGGTLQQVRAAREVLLAAGAFNSPQLLQLSGLVRDREYFVQESLVAADGSRQQPDVRICLPADRNLIVDSKVSLVAYERYASAESDEARAAAVQQHLASLRTHIKGLSEKNYPALYGLESLDFVLMFVPVEAALLTARRSGSGKRATPPVRAPAAK